MARLSKVEACMFCDDLPCTCNAKPKAAPKPKKDTPATQAPVVNTSPKEIVFAPAQQTPRNKFARDAPEPVRETTDEEFTIMEAIRNLEPLLSDLDKEKWKFVLKPTRSPDLDRRLTEWRKRNGFG